MNLQELQQQIMNNQLNDLYIFIGEEIAIQKIYINKIAASKGLEIQYIDSYKQIINNLNVNDLFNIKKLYVILDDMDILKQEFIWQNINANGNMLIFKYNNLDKRSKFYKYFESNGVEFNKLSNEILIKYIQKDLPGLLEVNCEKLIYICDNDYNRILSEIDKIKNYDIHNEHNYNTYFIALDKQEAFHKDVSDITYEFIDAIVVRDLKRIAKLQREWQRQNDSCLGILSLLYNNFKIILLIQSCNSNDICKTTGLQNNQVYYNKDKTGYYSIGELVNVLRIIQKVESGIKKGIIEEQIALDYILLNII